MRTAIRKHRWDFIAVVAIFVVAMFVGTFILSHQRFYLPHWVPVVGSVDVLGWTAGVPPLPSAGPDFAPLRSGSCWSLQGAVLLYGERLPG